MDHESDKRPDHSDSRELNDLDTVPLFYTYHGSIFLGPFIRVLLWISVVWEHLSLDGPPPVGNRHARVFTSVGCDCDFRRNVPPHEFSPAQDKVYDFAWAVGASADDGGVWEQNFYKKIKRNL